MHPIQGFQPTGRSTIGPGSDLVEYEGDDGFRHTAVVFHPECRDHPAINSALDVVLGFLEAPYVTGLLELVAMDHDQGAFVYPSGQAWSASEVVRTLADMGMVAGIRAGLELMYSAGEVLIEAAEAGEPHGVYSHGGLTPWRVMLKGDGQVEILGYALPQVEILQFQADTRQVPNEDSFRYCPPERMEAGGEDLSADLFGLALVAFELMTGKPVYDGLVNDIRTQASRGEGSRRLFRFKEQLPPQVSDLLKTALRARPEDRHEDGQAFLDDVRSVLSSGIEGPSLMDVMAQVGSAQRRIGEGLDDGKTMGMSREEIARILGDEEEEKTEAPKARSKAWSPPSKGRRRRTARRSGDDEAPERESQARRPRRSREPEPVPVEPDPEPTPEPTPEPETAPRTRPKRSAQQAVASSGRWGKPSGGRRPRRARNGSEDLPSAEPKQPAPKQPEASADELIRKITTSSGDSPARDDGRSASDVIEAILQGSSSGDKPKAAGRSPRRAPEKVPEAPPNPFGHSEPIPKKARPRRPARPDPAKPDAPTGAHSPLARTPSGVRELRQQAPGARRAPDPIPPSAGGKAIAFRIHRGPGGTAVKTRIPGNFSLSEAVSFLTGTVVPVRTDLQGRVRVGYRLGTADGPLAGDTQIATLEGTELILHPVVAREVWMTVEVATDPATTFRTPVSTALPASSVVDALAAWLNLPAGKWYLKLWDASIGPHTLMDELDLSDATLVLTR